MSLTHDAPIPPVRRNDSRAPPRAEPVKAYLTLAPPPLARCRGPIMIACTESTDHVAYRAVVECRLDPSDLILAPEGYDHIDKELRLSYDAAGTS